MRHNISIRKNAVLNVIRQACAIAFPFLTFIYATHILGAEQMGVHAFGQSVVSYFIYIAMMGIPDYAVREAAMLRDDDEKLCKFVNEIFSINLITMAMAYGMLFLLLEVWGKLHPYRYVILVQSIQIVLTAFGADWINVAFEDFLYLTVRYIAIGAGCILAMLLFVKNEKDLYAYSFLLMFSAAGGNIWNIFYVRRYIKIRPTLCLNLKKHIPSMLMFFCSSIALVIYLNSDMTILGLIKDDITVGIYSVSTKIYLMIKALVNAVIMAVVARLSYQIAHSQLDSYRQTVSKLVDSLFLLIIPASVGLFFEAENIIYFAAGSGYLEGTAVLQIYSVVIVVAVFSCLFSYAVLMPFHMEKFFMAATVPAAVINIGINFFLIPILGMYGAAITTFIAELVVLVITSFFARGKVKLKICSRDLGIDLVGGILVGCICIAIEQIKLDPGTKLWISVIMSGLVYCVTLLILNNSTLLEFIRSIFKNNSSWLN